MTMQRSMSIRSRRRGRCGATIVEIALALMVILLLVIGTIEFGRAAWTYNTLAHATRQGARYAMAHGSQSNPTSASGVSSYVKNSAIGLNKSDISVTTTWPSGVKRNGMVSVHSEYTFRSAAGTLLFKPGYLTFKSTSTVYVAN
jgi:Flp pilus assembly protein TadG